ncbi:MAG: ATP-binding protein, partial [Terracidiphilus sp.]
MRRRSRRGPNTSESTGKIGQELPSNQPAPLVPLYPDDTPPRPQHGQQRPQEARHAAPSRPQPAAKQEWNVPPGSGRLEVETQPEMPAMPARTSAEGERSPTAPKW